MHFRLADLRVFRRDAEVARLRDLEAAAERVAVDSRDERLRRILDALQQGVRASERVIESAGVLSSSNALMSAPA